MRRLVSLFAILAISSVFVGCGPDTSVTTTDPPPPMTEDEVKEQQQHYQQPNMSDRK